MDPVREREILLTRRQLLGKTSTGIGVAALASLLNPNLFADEKAAFKPGAAAQFGGLPDMPNFAPKAKRVIFLHQSGAPSQIDRSSVNRGVPAATRAPFWTARVSSWPAIGAATYTNSPSR